MRASKARAGRSERKRDGKALARAKAKRELGLTDQY
jgi:hypothetical protein